MSHLIPLIVVVVLFAALLVAHLSLLLQVMSSSLSAAWKIAALVPFVTPVAALRSRAFVGTAAWVLFLGGYVWARVHYQ